MGGECGWDANKQTDREINKKTINIYSFKIMAFFPQFNDYMMFSLS